MIDDFECQYMEDDIRLWLSDLAHCPSGNRLPLFIDVTG